MNSGLLIGGPACATATGDMLCLLFGGAGACTTAGWDALACATATWDMLRLLFGGAGARATAGWDALWQQILGHCVWHRDLERVTLVVWWGGRLRHISFQRVMTAFLWASRVPPRPGTCYACCLVWRALAPQRIGTHYGRICLGHRACHLDVEHVKLAVW